MRIRCAVPLAAAAILVPVLAQAHISIKSSPAVGALTDVVVFGVGHGCEADGDNLDTISVTIEVPKGVTSIRPELSGFDNVSLETDKAGLVTAVTWTKSQALQDDIAYYELRVRLKTPDAPFTQLKFPAHQRCASADGETEATVDWVGDEGDPDLEPAPVLTVLPAHSAGWNKYTVEEDITSLEVFFSDAQIVWQGSAAYSSNPTTTELIAETDGVSSLVKIKANKEFWVKY